MTVRLRARALLALPLLLAVALAGCGGPETPDTDGDGIVDPQEEAGWTVVVDLVGKRIQRHVTSDPALADTDGDGLPDPIEAQYPGGLDPRDADTDDDGLGDCTEALHTVEAECGKPGIAYDGGHGTSANNADSEPGGRYYTVHAAYLDETGTVTQLTWGDGIADGEELAGYPMVLPGNATRTVRSSPLRADSDDDGLHDGEERFVWRTDPTSSDSDGDGCRDGLDLAPARAETFGLGLKELRLANGTTGQVGLTVQDVAIHRIPANGTFAAGAATSLAGLSPSGYRPDGCPVRTGGRVPIQVAAFLQTPSGPRVLDLSSLAPGPLHWDFAQGGFAWSHDGPATPGAATLSGPDGELVLEPFLS